MIVPPVAHGLRIMSIGFFLDPEQAVVWRGPMLHRALEQFLTDVHWGELDYLVVDMPPGTGDVAISLGQLLPEPDLLVVTTPQPAAQRVAARTAEVAEQDRHARGGRDREHELRRCARAAASGRTRSARAAARRWPSELGVPLLGEIPLDEPLRVSADGGTPLVVSAPDADSAQAVAALAEGLPGALRPRSGAERISRRLGVLS